MSLDLLFGMAAHGTSPSFAQPGWFWQNPLPQGNDLRALLGVSFVDANTGTAVGERGTILRTEDGGATWTLPSSGTTDIAAWEGLIGTLTIKCLLTTEGVFKDCAVVAPRTEKERKILETTGQAAKFLKAFSTWRYTPAQFDGEPCEIEYLQRVLASHPLAPVSTHRGRIELLLSHCPRPVGTPRKRC